MCLIRSDRGNGFKMLSYIPEVSAVVAYRRGLGKSLKAPIQEVSTIRVVASLIFSQMTKKHPFFDLPEIIYTENIILISV